MCLAGREGAPSFYCLSTKCQIAPVGLTASVAPQRGRQHAGGGIGATRRRKEVQMIILRYDCMSSGAVARPNMAGQIGEDFRR